MTEDSDRSPFDRWWQQLQDSGYPLPFVLIDCAGFEGGETELPREVVAELECLLTGELAEELADVSGYLGRLRDWSDGSRDAAFDLMKRQLALLLLLPAELAAPPSFAQLHRHLRKFNLVYGPDRQPLFWRYYDPRALPQVLAVLDSQQRAAFFGPLEVAAWTDEVGQLTWARCVEGEMTVLTA